MSVLSILKPVLWMSCLWVVLAGQPHDSGSLPQHQGLRLWAEQDCRGRRCTKQRGELRLAIVLEWYFLWVDAILRSIPSKLAGGKSYWIGFCGFGGVALIHKHSTGSVQHLSCPSRITTVVIRPWCSAPQCPAERHPAWLQCQCSTSAVYNGEVHPAQLWYDCRFSHIMLCQTLDTGVGSGI